MENKKGITIAIVSSMITIIVISTVFFTAQSVYGGFFSRNLDRDSKTEAILDLLDNQYVGEYDAEDLEENMYRGLVAGINDPYTTYMDKDTFSSFMELTEGTYAGIGVVVSGENQENQVQVETPYKDAPGYNAGLRTGDRILRANGIELYGDKLDEATNLIKGEEGTTVTLTIRTPDGKEKDVDVVREKINIPTIEHEMLENKTGYIKITNFDRVTRDQYFEAYKDLQSQNMESLIIDVRDNPGGLLDVVVDITDSLVPEGTIVYTEDRDGTKEYEYSDSEQVSVPLAILVNEYSASASEVLTGAVKDMGVATIVGENTYGKGVVQNIFPLSDGSAVKITIAKYYTPSGICIQDIGIEPDVIVPYDEIKNGSSSILTFEEDIQLQEAFDVVNSQK